jgi:hypothetical protein
MNHPLVRAVMVWLLLIGVETVHGILRPIFLAPLVGDLSARGITVFTGSLLILIVAGLTVRWIRASGKRQLLLVGLIWVILTMLFEVALGRWVLDLPWERIYEDYDLRNGGFLGLGMLFMFFSPLLASQFRKR